MNIHSPRELSGRSPWLARLSISLPALTLNLAGMLGAAAASFTASSNPNLAIPDNNLVGVTDVIHLTAPIDVITSITLTLDIEGGFNGDYFAYLRDDDAGFVVLLNRIGRNTDPLTVLDTDARDSLLGSFSGSDPDALWTLFIVDVSPVGSGTLMGWSHTVSGPEAELIPERGGMTAAAALAAIISLGLIVRRRRLRA